MKLSSKLMIAPLVAIGFLVALALAGYYALTLQQEAADSFYEGTFSRYEYATDTETNVGKVHAGIYRLLNIRRQEPDASLFQLPADYVVTETGIRKLDFLREQK